VLQFLFNTYSATSSVLDSAATLVPKKNETPVHKSAVTAVPKNESLVHMSDAAVLRLM